MRNQSEAVAESPTVSKERKEIYLSEALKRLLRTRPKDSLTTVVNLISDRYQGIIERMGKAIPCTVREEDVYRAVLEESRGRRLEAREIALFPNMVADWLGRNPEYPQSAYERVSVASFVELVALIERLERDQ